MYVLFPHEYEHKQTSAYSFQMHFKYQMFALQTDLSITHGISRGRLQLIGEIYIYPTCHHRLDAGQNVTDQIMSDLSPHDMQ